MEKDEDHIEIVLLTVLLTLAQEEISNIMMLKKELINVLTHKNAACK